MRTAKYFGILPLLSLVALPQETATMKAVEGGLLPPYSIEGTGTPKWNLSDRMAFYKVPAMGIALIRNGKIEWAKTYGVIEKGGPAANSETLFQAASISKPVTALAAMSMVQKGRITLDEDVNGKLKSWKVPDNEFTVKEKVTARRLMSHSAGMTVHGFPGYAADAPVPSLVQILNGTPPANTPAIRVEAIPGSKWNYSGGGFTVLQQLMIDVAGKPFSEIMRETVLSPLEMQRSTYQQPLPAQLRANAARAYKADGSAIEGLWHTYPELAAAGLWTTPADLAKFAVEIRRAARGESSRVINQATAKAMLTVQNGESGLGIGLAGTEGPGFHFGHGGANEGYRCDFQMYLESGDGAVIMTNSDAGGSLASEVMRAISAAYDWPDFKPRTKKVITVGPATLSSYAGQYLVEGMKIEVSMENGKLWIDLPQSARAQLFPESDTQFFIGDMNLPTLTFVKSEQGEVTGFKAFGQTARKRAK